MAYLFVSHTGCGVLIGQMTGWLGDWVGGRMDIEYITGLKVES